MNKNKHSHQSTALTYFLLLGLLCLSVNSQALTLNGVSAYSELRKDYYLAALYLQNTSQNPNEILSSEEHKQMRLLVTADRWTPRLWQKQWLNNIAINNEPVLGASQLQSDITFFTQLPEHDLTKGDLMVIDYQPGVGTRVVLNKRVFIQSKDSGLFRHLLSTWIGKLPPSREFKNQILSVEDNQDATNLSQQIQRHTVSSQRIAEIAAWYSQKNEVKEPTKVESSQIQLAKAKEAQQEKELAKLRQALAQAKEETKKAEAEKARQAQLAKERELARQRLAREKAAQEKRNRQLKLAKKKTEREQKLEQFYYKDLFEWQLRQAIRQEVVYPEWAKQFQQQGSVSLAFELNRDGKVSEVIFEDDGAAKMLNSALESAVRQAAKKVTAPAELKGDQWRFTAHHRFNLRDDDQEALAEPKMPAHLEQKGGERNSKVVAAYMDDVRKRIVSEIKYPAEAIMLKKRGKASLFVTVNASGRVTNVFDRYTPKHKVFRNALTDAVNRAKPLPPLPKGIGKSELTIDVEYEFKR